MAWITSFTQKIPDRESRHSKAEATWHAGGVGPDKYLQIDTYGSRDRILAGKISQSIRLDARAAAELKALIEKTFPN
jgi:hypothetical protein